MLVGWVKTAQGTGRNNRGAGAETWSDDKYVLCLLCDALEWNIGHAQVLFMVVLVGVCRMFCSNQQIVRRWTRIASSSMCPVILLRNH